MENKNTLWDFTKCQLRSVTITYSKKIAYEKKKRETELKHRIENLEKEIVYNGDKVEEYYETKGNWEGLQREKTEGIILRSKAKWAEAGERNTKYFLNLEKRNYNIKYIKKLITENGTEELNPQEIIKEQQNFYKSLYSSRNLENFTNETFFKNLQIPQLLNTDKSWCDENITTEEIAKSLKALANDKTPGSDGFSINFYKFFWSDIKLLLTSSFVYTFENGCLSNDQKRGIINLIPKEGKDLRYLRNWRPISLLNADYKILTKVLSNRLQHVLPRLIHSDQIGYIKGRYIGQNIRIIKDLMTYTKNNNSPGFLLLVDFEKAFDSVEWSFMVKCLDRYNFGQNFIKWIKILYTDIESCVCNNGYLSQYFKLGRGIRQGCPISAMLFILVSEILAINLRHNKLIKGITVNNEEYKLCQLADDTTLILHDIRSIVESISTMTDFKSYSGLNINLDKTVIIPLGICKNKHIKLPKELQKLSVNNQAFKTLGIWFSNDQEQMTELNFDRKLKNMEGLMNIWFSRNLTLKGKVTILKILVLPQITHLLSMCFCPHSILDQIDKLFFNFLWDKKSHKIKKGTIIAGHRDGGLAMPDIFTIHTKAKVSWLKRLNVDDESKWSKLMWYMLNIDKHLINHKVPKSYANNSLTPFHEQILHCWHQAKCTSPNSVDEIYEEYLFDNMYICSNGKPLDLKQFKLNKAKNKDLKVKSLFDSNGGQINFLGLKQNLHWNISIFSYNLIYSAIPKAWKRKIRGFKPPENVHSEFYLRIKGSLTNLNSISNKDLYSEILTYKIKEPTAISTWLDIFPFLEVVSWKNIFKNTHQVAPDTYLQTFQFKIMHRLTNCNYNLFKWNIKDTPYCDYCNIHIDTLEHHFYLCAYCKSFWEKVGDYLTRSLNLDKEPKLTICEVIFGIECAHNPRAVNRVINMITLIGKWYINNNRANGKLLSIHEFISLVKSKMYIYKLIYEKADESINKEICQLLNSFKL